MTTPQDRLRKMAQEAIDLYNAEIKAGEPVDTRWANDLFAVLKELSEVTEECKALSRLNQEIDAKLAKYEAAPQAAALTDEQIIQAANKTDSDLIRLVVTDSDGNKRPTFCAKQFARALLSPAPAPQPQDSIGDRYAHRLAVMLECALLNPNGTWDDAHKLLDEYRAEHGREFPSPATFMGEPVIEAPQQEAGQARELPDFLEWWTSIETDERKAMFRNASARPEYMHSLLRKAYEAGVRIAAASAPAEKGGDL